MENSRAENIQQKITILLLRSLLVSNPRLCKASPVLHTWDDLCCWGWNSLGGSAGVTGLRTEPGAQKWTGACSHSSAICWVLLQPPKPSYTHLTYFFSNLNVGWFFYFCSLKREIKLWPEKKRGAAGRTHLAQELWELWGTFGFGSATFSLSFC